MTARAATDGTRGVRAGAGFVRSLVASRLYRPDGSVETERAPAVWTLAHRGYSGGGRLDVWVYPSRRAALQAGAELALASGLDADPAACAQHEAGRYQAVLDRYEATHPDGFVLRVQAAFLQFDESGPRGG